ncbi:hypothetical protein ACQ4LE_007653 [Meloidogyne hapla]|uniref:Uncharacterized protein n=1 Tax=Meloidogyne hapla TaxID=6305 RepID=A0A1I8BC54_MELHA
MLLLSGASCRLLQQQKQQNPPELQQQKKESQQHYFQQENEDNRPRLVSIPPTMLNNGNNFNNNLKNGVVPSPSSCASHAQGLRRTAAISSLAQCARWGTALENGGGGNGNKNNNNDEEEEEENVPAHTDNNNSSPSPPMFSPPFSSFCSPFLLQMSNALAICPAPANQVELDFSLEPSSSSFNNNSQNVRLLIRSPSGDSAQLFLSSGTPTGSFCAKNSNRCGHGQWSVRVNDGEEQRWTLDGVGSLHFRVLMMRGRGHYGDNSPSEWRLELADQEFLRVPTIATCPLMAMMMAKQKQKQRN